MSISMRSGALPMRCTVPSTLPAVAGSIFVIGPCAVGEMPVVVPVSERLQPPAASRAQESSRGRNDRLSDTIAVLSLNESKRREHSVGKRLRACSAAHIARQHRLLRIHLVERSLDA